MSVNTSTVRLQSRSTGEEQITIAEYRQLQPQKHYFDQLNNLQITCDPRKNISENAVPQKWSWSEMMSAFQNQIQMAHIQKYMNTGLMLLQKVSRIVNQKIILSKKMDVALLLDSFKSSSVWLPLTHYIQTTESW